MSTTLHYHAIYVMMGRLMCSQHMGPHFGPTHVQTATWGLPGDEVAPNILPSTLSPGLDNNDSDLVVQFLKPDAAKSIWQDVGLLLTSPDELHVHRALLDAVLYEVIAEIDVLTLVETLDSCREISPSFCRLR